MRIDSLHIDKFGKLRDLTLRFGSGMTVIYGGNESGKSTLMSFIRAMLYGLNGRSANVAVNDRKRCMPWGETAMGGSLRLTDGGETWEIVRTFGLTAKGDTCRVVNANTGELLGIPAGKEPGDVLLGLDEEVFADTLFVSNKGSKLSGDGAALGERMHNLLSSGREDVALDAVMQRLQTARSAIQPRVRDRGQLYAVRKELDEARRRTAEEQQLDAEIAALNERIRQQGAKPDLTDWDNNQARLLQLESKMEQEQQAEAQRKQSRRITAGILFAAAGVLALASALLALLLGMKWLWGAAIAVAPLGAALALLFVKRVNRRMLYLQNEIANVRREQEKTQQVVKGDEERKMIELHVQLDRLQRTRQAMEEERKRVEELEAREKTLLLHLEALDMAQEELRAAAKERQEGIAPELLRGMEDLLSGLTAGKYDSPALTREMQPSLRSEKTLHDSAYFSTGTVEQMYLALRLSMAGLLMRDSALPVLLDDPFAHYDDERAGDALELLRDWAADNRQVLLLTCRKRDTKGLSVIHLQ